MFIRPNQSRRGWSDWHVLGVIVMVGVGIAATYGSWQNIWTTLNARGETRHLLLMPLAIIWLVWVRRARFKWCEPTGNWIGPIAVVSGWVLSAGGNYLQLEILWHFGAVSVLVGCIVSVLGEQVLVAFRPAFGVLLFLIPLPGRIESLFSGPLEEIATTLVQPLVGLNTIAVREGPAALLCATLIAYTFAFAMPYRRWVRAVLILSSPLAAVAVLTVQVLLFKRFEQAGLLDSGQFWASWSGWLLVPLTLALLLGLVHVLRWAAVPLQHYKLADETSVRPIREA